MQFDQGVEIIRCQVEQCQLRVSDKGNEHEISHKSAANKRPLGGA